MWGCGGAIDPVVGTTVSVSWRHGCLVGTEWACGGDHARYSAMARHCNSPGSDLGFGVLAHCGDVGAVGSVVAPTTALPTPKLAIMD